LGGKELRRILSIHPLYDETVPIADTITPGATEMTVNTKGHVFSIFYTIIFRPIIITRFLKAQPKK
jgi:hypothetical protein